MKPIPSWDSKRDSQGESEGVTFGKERLGWGSKSKEEGNCKGRHRDTPMHA